VLARSDRPAELPHQIHVRPFERAEPQTAVLAVGRIEKCRVGDPRANDLDGVHFPSLNHHPAKPTKTDDGLFFTDRETSKGPTGTKAAGNERSTVKAPQEFMRHSVRFAVPVDLAAGSKAYAQQSISNDNKANSQKNNQYAGSDDQSHGVIRCRLVVPEQGQRVTDSRASMITRRLSVSSV
jgi:hypothetical protein